jgi:hypothetical protein
VEAKEREKAERLAPAIEAALARRDPPRQAPPDYVIDEEADLARLGAGRRPAARRRPRAVDLGRKTREAIERGGRGVLARAVRGASDRQLERRFGNRVVQRALFTGMAQRFRPIPGFGFEGNVLYELTHLADGAEPDRWTIQVREGRARAVEGGAPDPAVTIRMSISDFARIAADDVKPPGLFFSGRLDIEGDFEVASRLPEMFGEPSPF